MNSLQSFCVNCFSLPEVQSVIHCFLRDGIHRGQVSVNISKPGITKGQHWHGCKNEICIVVKGHALIRMRNLRDGEVEEYEVSGDRIRGVWMKPGRTHDIVNLSDAEDLVTVMWASENFDPTRHLLRAGVMAVGASHNNWVF